jgi:hypothetical protein
MLTRKSRYYWLVKQRKAIAEISFNELCRTPLATLRVFRLRLRTPRGRAAGVAFQALSKLLASRHRLSRHNSGISLKALHAPVQTDCSTDRDHRRIARRDEGIRLRCRLG